MWFKNGRKYILTPKITNLAKYKASWQNWWHGLQPKWRLREDGIFLQEVPDVGEDWGGLRRGGPNGFFIIVLAFAWWVEAADGKADDAGLDDALDDITWVARCMADMPTVPNQLIGAKHTRDDELTTSTMKRYALRVSFHITSQANGVNMTGGKRSELGRRGERIIAE